MTRLRIAPLARSDLDEIHDYIARDKPVAAERWLDRTHEKFAFLATHPSIGEHRDNLRPNLRSISQGSYVIYFRYLVEQDVLEIARVIHGARDITQIGF